MTVSIMTGLMIALTLLAVELVIRADVSRHIRAIFRTVDEAARTLRSSAIADDVKEAMARRSSATAFTQTGLFCGKLAVVAVIVAAVYWLAARGLHLRHQDFSRMVLSWKAMVGVTILAVLYVRVRHVFTR